MALCLIGATSYVFHHTCMLSCEGICGDIAEYSFQVPVSRSTHSLCLKTVACVFNVSDKKNLHSIILEVFSVAIIIFHHFPTNL